MESSAAPPIEKLRGRKIGKILWRLGKLSEEQLKQALVRQQRENTGQPIGNILVQLGFCTEKDIREALAAQNGTEMVSRVDLAAVRGAPPQQELPIAGAPRPVAAAAGSREGAVGLSREGAVSGEGTIELSREGTAVGTSSDGPLSSEDAGGTANDKLKGRRLGKILWRLGKLTEAQLKSALVAQQRGKGGSPLGAVLIEMKICTEADIKLALAAQAGEPISGSRTPVPLARSGASDEEPAIEIPNLNLDEILGTPGAAAANGNGSNGASATDASDPASTASRPVRSKKAGAVAPIAPAGASSSQADAALAKLKGRKIGKILWRQGKVTEEQLKEGLVRQLSSRSGGPLGGILVELGYCTADDVRGALAAQRGVSIAEVAEETVETDRSAEETGAGEAVGGQGEADGPGEPVAIEKLKGRRIGKILWRMGKVSLGHIKEALLEQKKTRSGMLGQILVRLGHCTDADVEAALAAQLGIETVDLKGVEIPPEVIAKLTPQTANLYRAVPLEYSEAGKILKVALDSPDNFQATDDLRTLFGFNVRPVITDPGTMDALLTKYYGETGGEMDAILQEINASEELAQFQNRGESIDLNDIKEMVEAAPVKKLLNLVLLQAIKDKASDIHFEPFEDEFKMRYRVDGVLYEMVPPPKHIALAISSRVKVMSNLDIAERRLPQDGRIALTVHGRAVDLRVSVLPTMFGESVVMRVLDRSQVSLDLNKLGLREQDLMIFRQLIRRPNGVCIVTGPTGSGKTTTLYSALQELNDISSKLITCEDPVEYDIDGIIQVQINSEIQMTFAKALRAILRQDPDIVLVGECRDLETAQISVQAALTGHLVFTTLHTNDAPSAIARLLDMGLQPYLITAVIEGILAQRLVRKICQHCKTEYTPTEENLLELELRPEDIAGRSFFMGKGCDYCNNTGYKGRMGIHEIMLMDDDIRELIMQRASTNVIRNEARKRGMRNLRESGLLAIYDGMTTIEEVVKETVMDD